MNIKKLGKVLLVALIAVILVVSVLPTSAAATKSVFYGTPKIDGKLDSIWSGASEKTAIDMYYEGDLEGYATGYASMLWDNDNLYVLGYAYDKTKSLKESGTAWFTDGIEIFLDERYAHNSVKNEIAQIRVNRNGSLSGMLLGVATDENGILAEYAGTKWAKAEVDDGYFIELAIPWTRIKGKVAKGTKIGVVFQINDDFDNDGTEKSLTVINSESIDKWQPQFLMTFTLSSTKAEDPNAVDSKPSDTTENKDTASDKETSENNNNTAGNNTTQNKDNEASKKDDSTESAVSDTATSKDESATSENSTDVGDTVSDGSGATDKDGAENTGDSNDETVNTEYADIGEVIPKSIIIAFVTVAAVIVLAIIVCLVILLKPRKKKSVKPAQRENTEENNAE